MQWRGTGIQDPALGKAVVRYVQGHGQGRHSSSIKCTVTQFSAGRGRASAGPGRVHGEDTLTRCTRVMHDTCLDTHVPSPNPSQAGAQPGRQPQ